MFFRKNEINPFPISDTIRFRNVDRVITLTVKSGASSMILGVKKAQERLTALNDNSTDEDRYEGARFFAETLFGKEQADRLFDFYDGDPLVIIAVCGQYFSTRLAKIITKAQKK